MRERWVQSQKKQFQGWKLCRDVLHPAGISELCNTLNNTDDIEGNRKRGRESEEGERHKQTQERGRMELSIIVYSNTTIAVLYTNV